ncbi:glycine cleavage system protein GcvH [Candidatus Margulisiibacteriota bacterium]
MYPEELKYSKDHEWIKVEGNIVTIGISEYAQAALGDVVYVELPKIGEEIKAEQEFGVVESVKTVSNLIAPVSGKVVEENSELASTPALVNQEPYGKGWMIKIEMANPQEVEKLMGAKDYVDQLSA